MASLTPEEEASALEMAASPAVREDMRRLRGLREERPMDLADYIAFLDAHSRLFPATAPRGPIRGERFLL